MTEPFAQTHDRQLFHSKLLQHARFLQQTRQSWMYLGRCIQCRHGCLSLLPIQREALPVSQGFSRAGKGAPQYEICHAALGCRRCSLEGLLCPWSQPQVQLLTAQGDDVIAAPLLITLAMPAKQRHDSTG